MGRSEEAASKAHQQLQDALGVLEKYIAQNRLYLADDISAQLEGFCKSVSKAATSIGSFTMSLEDGDKEHKEHMRQELNQALTALNVARKCSEGAFKVLLGVGPETASDTSR